MHEVQFSGSTSTTVTCEREVSLLVLAKRAGVALTSTCGGHARCGTCRVTITEGAANLTPMGSRERDLLARKEAGAEDRLACQAWVRGPVCCKL